MRTTMNELWESYHHGLMVCASLLSIKSLLGAAAFVFPDAEAGLQLAARTFGVLLGFAFFVTATIFLVRQTRLYLSLTGPADLHRRGRLHEDGFTFHVLKTAALLSCAVTVVTLYILDLTIAEAVLPPAFFVKLVLFLSLSTFSAVYFVMHVSPAEQPSREAARCASSSRIASECFAPSTASARRSSRRRSACRGKRSARSRSVGSFHRP